MRQRGSFVQSTNFVEVYFCSDCLLNLQHTTFVTGSSRNVKEERVRLIKERDLGWCVRERLFLVVGFMLVTCN
jgi:hypothetical protein